MDCRGRFRTLYTYNSKHIPYQDHVMWKEKNRSSNANLKTHKAQLRHSSPCKSYTTNRKAKIHFSCKILWTEIQICKRPIDITNKWRNLLVPDRPSAPLFNNWEVEVLPNYHQLLSGLAFRMWPILLTRSFRVHTGNMLMFLSTFNRHNTYGKLSWSREVKRTTSLNQRHMNILVNDVCSLTITDASAKAAQVINIWFSIGTKCSTLRS